MGWNSCFYCNPKFADLEEFGILYEILTDSQSSGKKEVEEYLVYNCLKQWQRVKLLGNFVN